MQLNSKNEMLKAQPIFPITNLDSRGCFPKIIIIWPSFTMKEYKPSSLDLLFMQSDCRELLDAFWRAVVSGNESKVRVYCASECVYVYWRARVLCSPMALLSRFNTPSPSTKTSSLHRLLCEREAAPPCLTTWLSAFSPLRPRVLPNTQGNIIFFPHWQSTGREWREHWRCLASAGQVVAAKK